MGTAIANTLADDLVNVVEHHSRAIASNATYVKEALRVTGGSGLAHDKAGGSLTNGRTTVANTIDHQGIFKQNSISELRLKNNNRLENILPIASNVRIDNNASTSPLPTNGVALTNCPGGFTTGFQYAAGCTNYSQRNFTIVADTAKYNWSIIVYNTDPGGGAVLQLSALGISGGEATGNDQYYNFDTQQLTISNMRVEDLGNNYYRFSRTFKNDGTRTLFIFRLNGSVTGMSKLIFTGHQLIKFPSDILPIGRNVPPIISKGILSAPYHGAGIDAVKYYDKTPQAFNQVRIWGDSLPGSSATTWGSEFLKYFGNSTQSAVGGETSTQIKTRFLAGTTHDTDLIIIDAGTNNAVEATILADLAEMVAAITHTRFIICGIFTNNTSDNYIGTSGYNNRVAINNAIRAEYPNNFVDILQVLLDNYNANDPVEAAEHALGVTGSNLRLQTDTLHPSAEAQVLICNALWDYAIAQGMVDDTAYSTTNKVLTHEPATDNLALFPRDLTNAAWVKVTCTAAKTSTGIDGVASSCSRLTATGANATCLQTVTSASANRVTGAFVKRITGTGVIEMTQDNGSTWTPVTITSAFTLLLIPAATVENPILGFRIVTSGDAIDVDYVQHELGSYLTSPISGSRTIDSIKIPLSAGVNFNQTKGICLLKLKMNFADSATAKSLFSTNTTATDFIHDNGSGAIALNDGTNTATADPTGWAAGDTLIIAAVWNTDTMSIHVKKNTDAWIDSSNTTYDGAFPAGANLLFCNGNTDAVDIYHAQIIDTNMTLAASQTWIKANAATLIG